MADSLISTQYFTGLVGEVAETFYDHLIGKGITTVTQADIEELIIRYKESRVNTPLVLSAVKPDFEQILAQMLSELTRRPNAWREINIAGGGRTLIDMVAAGIALLQNSIERGLQEVQGFDTAQAPASIYMLTRFLGVYIKRKTPAQVEVTLTNSETTLPVVIPRLSAFSIDGVKFFNRTQITFPPGTAELEGVMLYQGEVINTTEVSTGQTLQKFELGNEDFTCSDEDIYAFVGPQNEEYIRDIKGLYHYGPNALVFYENTLPNGNVEVTFGTGEYGFKPEGSSEIRFQYVQTLGEKGNKAASGRSVQITAFNSISGITTSFIENGSDEKDHEFYRTLAPNLYATRDRYVTREDFKAGALLYPGVIDAMFIGQQEIAPDQVTFINFVQAHVVLKSPTFWTVEEQILFRKYMELKAVGNVKVGVLEATKTPIAVKAKVYCQTGIDLLAAKNHLINAIREEFAPKLGVLGRPRFKSDITRLLQDPQFKVDYVQLEQPSVDNIINNDAYITLDLDELDIQTFYSARSFGGPV